MADIRSFFGGGGPKKVSIAKELSPLLCHMQVLNVVTSKVDYLVISAQDSNFVQIIRTSSCRRGMPSIISSCSVASMRNVFDSQ